MGLRSQVPSLKVAQARRLTRSVQFSSGVDGDESCFGFSKLRIYKVTPPSSNPSLSAN
ncbi:MAG: hypothetical protein PVS2B1_26420 [Candidatus Dormibacteraceae bacterium]